MINIQGVRAVLFCYYKDQCYCLQKERSFIVPHSLLVSSHIHSGGARTMILDTLLKVFMSSMAGGPRNQLLSAGTNLQRGKRGVKVTIPRLHLPQNLWIAMIASTPIFHFLFFFFFFIFFFIFIFIFFIVNKPAFAQSTFVPVGLTPPISTTSLLLPSPIHLCLLGSERLLFFYPQSPSNEPLSLFHTFSLAVGKASAPQSIPSRNPRCPRPSPSSCSPKLSRSLCWQPSTPLRL